MRNGKALRSLTEISFPRCFRWFGHILRMPSRHLPFLFLHVLFEAGRSSMTVGLWTNVQFHFWHRLLFHICVVGARSTTFADYWMHWETWRWRESCMAYWLNSCSINTEAEQKRNHEIYMVNTEKELVILAFCNSPPPWTRFLYNFALILLRLHHVCYQVGVYARHLSTHFIARHQLHSKSLESTGIAPQ